MSLPAIKTHQDQPEVEIIIENHKLTAMMGNRSHHFLVSSYRRSRRRRGGGSSATAPCCCWRDSKEGQRILDGLSRNDVDMTRVEITGNDNFEAQDLELLMKALQSNTHLLTLKLCRNQISDEMLIQACENLPPGSPACFGHNLRLLGLFGNHIGDTGLKALLPTLQATGTLQTLFLGHNQISSQGLTALVQQLLPSLPHLEWLNISSNSAIGEGVHALRALGEVLPNTKIQKLGLACLQLTDAALEPLMDALASGWQFQWMDLTSNDISDKGALGMVKVLDEIKCKNNQQRFLPRLDLSYNPISNRGQDKLRRMISWSCHVQLETATTMPPKGCAATSCDVANQNKNIDHHLVASVPKTIVVPQGVASKILQRIGRLLSRAITSAEEQV